MLMLILTVTKCCVLPMLSVAYAEFHLCWVSIMLTVAYAECCLCWVLLILMVAFSLVIVMPSIVMLSVLTPLQRMYNFLPKSPKKFYNVTHSWTRTITVRVSGIKVSLLQRMRVKIDGKRVSLPYIKLGALSVMKDGYRVVLRTHEGKTSFVLSQN